MAKVFLDSETCGLHGMPVLLQYAYDDGRIILYEPWREPVGKTLDLIDSLLEHEFVLFNAAFDVFHLAKLYTTFRLCPHDWIPEQHVNEIAAREDEAKDGPGIKARGCLDLMLHSRKGRFQSLMSRSPIRIRKVPTVLAYALAKELEDRVEIDDVYFAKSGPDSPRWRVMDWKAPQGRFNDEFKDLTLVFNPAGGLKFLAEHAMDLKPKFHFKDVEVDRKLFPKELGYALTASALSSAERNWEVWDGDKMTGYAWPGVIHHHIKHWAENENAREYAKDDIVYTRGLYEYFDRPEIGDNDSELAWMVAVVRWHGFKINVPGLRVLLKKAEAKVASSPVNPNKPSEIRAYLTQCMDDIEAVTIEETTKKAKLLAIKDWEITNEPVEELDAEERIKDWEIRKGEECTKCEGNGCVRCDFQGRLQPGPHPAAVRAKEILDIKVAVKEVDLYKKLILAGRFHADFKVIGTFTSRMAGGGGLNAQGIKATKTVRSQFPLAWDGMQLCGGDFDSFEVTLADAVYNDANLRKALLSGKKIHALFGMAIFPGKTYDEIMASKDTEDDMYTKGKQAVFGLTYGGDWSTLVKNLGVKEEAAKAAFQDFYRRFPGIQKAREKTFKSFCSMSQPDGRQVIWRDPAEHVESFLGFRRYFTLENKIVNALYELARKLPKGWRNHDVKVVRRNRVQTAGGAVCSALYGAAFAQQAANMRAAANHEIQSPGGQITKHVQRVIWDLQPTGVHELVVAPLNVHDELMVVTRPDYVEKVTEAVRSTVESYRPQVPLIGMTWYEEMTSWAGKKSGTSPVKIRHPEMMEFE